MAWGELLREMQAIHVEIQQSLGFSPLWLSVPFILLAIVVGSVKVAHMVRRWWIRPYASPSRLLFQLAKVQGLSRREIGVLRGANPGASNLMHAQMLLDPAAWPSKSKSSRESNLFEKLFKEHLDHLAKTEA